MILGGHGGLFGDWQIAGAAQTTEMVPSRLGKGLLSMVTQRASS